VAFFFVLFFASEIIGMNPKLRDNSVLGVVFRVSNYLKPFRKEDDTIQKAKNSFK
jgi:hypothetical protein